MNFDKPTEVQLGLKKESAEGMDVESVEMTPDTENILKRVGVQHPEMVLEFALSGRDVKRGGAYEESLQDDPEALEVWKTIRGYVDENTGALETWLDSYAALNTLPLEDDGGESMEMEDFEKLYVIPQIQKTLQEKPIALTDFLRAVKINKLTLDAIPEQTPQQEAESLAKLHERIAADEAAQEAATGAITQASEEARVEEATAKMQADAILNKIQNM